MQEDKRDRLRSALTGLLEQIENMSMMGWPVYGEDNWNKFSEAVKTAKQALEGK